MKNLFLHLNLALVFIFMSLITNCLSGNAMDVNLGGTANLNINNANNNKLTTPLKNFSPAEIPPQQVDLSPLATPPLGGLVNEFAGNKINTDIIAPDIKNASEARELQRRTGTYIGKAPQTPPDNQAINGTDIQDFLKNYYNYLKDEGLSASSAPIITSNQQTKSTVITKQKASFAP